MDRKALQVLAIRHIQVRVTFAYVTRGSSTTVNSKVLKKAQDLEAQWASLLNQAEGAVQFVGASELWASISTPPSYTLQLTYQENATSGSSHVALVRLRDYLTFLTDEPGGLRRHIFDWNVRDYQGDVEVNQEIRTSILGKTYTLDDVQIANGLQTSHSLYRSLHGMSPENPALEKSRKNYYRKHG